VTDQEPERSERAARTLEQSMGHLGTWVALALFILAASVIAGYATHRASPGPSAWAAGISPLVLGATLLAVLWYSLETRRLVRLQRDAAEITDHPWLHVAAWPSSEALVYDPATQLKGLVAHLPIQNVGRTPALLRDISVTHELEPGSGECHFATGGDLNPRALAPGQGFTATIGELHYRSQEPPIVYVDVSIGYQTIFGATGLVVLALSIRKPRLEEP